MALALATGSLSRQSSRTEISSSGRRRSRCARVICPPRRYLLRFRPAAISRQYGGAGISALPVSRAVRRLELIFCRTAMLNGDGFDAIAMLRFRREKPLMSPPPLEISRADVLNICI